MSIQANKQNAISLQVAIEEYFRDNNLDEEMIDYDFGNDATTEWCFFCKGDDFKYIDDNELYAYIEDLKDFRNEEFEVFSYRDEISVRILNDEFEESKKSMKESEENFVYYIAVYDEDGNCRGYLQNESWRITQDIDKAMHFKRDMDAREVILKATKRAFNDDELYIEGMYLNESKESARKSLKEEKEVWIIKSKDDLQYVGKKIFDVCEDIENARKFKSKFEAEEFLKKHDKALDYRYWKVINIDSESKESTRKSIKEANESVIIDGKKTNFKINDYGTFFGEKIKYMLIGKPSENEDVLADFLEENSNFEFEEYKIPYSTVYYIYNDEKSLFGVAYRHYIRLTNDEKDAKIMLAYATDKRDLYNGL